MEEGIQQKYKKVLSRKNAAGYVRTSRKFPHLLDVDYGKFYLAKDPLCVCSEIFHDYKDLTAYVAYQGYFKYPVNGAGTAGLRLEMLAGQSMLE